MKTYSLRVVLEPDEDRWLAYCPTLEMYAVTTWGNTSEEALQHIQEVVQMVVQELVEDKEEIPVEPSSNGVDVSSEPIVAVTI